MKIGLDLDDTINDFINPYLERFGHPKDDYEITKNVNRILIHDKEFWLNLPIIHRPNFTPTLYCTKRVHNKAWSKKYLELNDIPLAPIYQIYSQSAPKSAKVKGKIDVFVDDSLSNFKELNANGVPCLLIDSPRNQEWGPIGRIYSLDIEEITEVYQLFKDTLLPFFRELI